MLEAMICFYGEELLAAQGRGAVAPRRGNRHAERAPQGCYRCAGEDRWIAISVTGDQEWRSLCEVAELRARPGAVVVRRARAPARRDRSRARVVHDAAGGRRVDAPPSGSRRDRGDGGGCGTGGRRSAARPRPVLGRARARRGRADPPARASRSDCRRRPRRSGARRPASGSTTPRCSAASSASRRRSSRRSPPSGVIADRPPPGASFRKNAKKPAAAAPSSAPIKQPSGANGKHHSRSSGGAAPNDPR